jgi:hypothetical protein
MVIYDRKYILGIKVKLEVIFYNIPNFSIENKRKRVITTRRLVYYRYSPKASVFLYK